jgi:hypothetical protein
MGAGYILLRLRVYVSLPLSFNVIFLGRFFFWLTILPCEYVGVVFGSWGECACSGLGGLVGDGDGVLILCNIMVLAWLGLFSTATGGGFAFISMCLLLCVVWCA